MPRIGLDDAQGGTTVVRRAARRTRASGAKPPTPNADDCLADALHLGHDRQGEGRAAPSPARTRSARSRMSRRTCTAHGERTLGVMPLYHTMGVRSLLAMALVDGSSSACRAGSGAALALIAARAGHAPVSRADALSRPARRMPISRRTDTVVGDEARLRRRADERRRC